MTFDEITEQVRALLQSKGRIAYRALKRRFDLDDEYIEDLKAELIDADRVAVDEDGKVLVWVGERGNGETGKRRNEETATWRAKWGNGEEEGTPGQWTPHHLAERIRAATLTEGERKTITALFADLKGSTALIEGLDPEEAQAIIDPALQLMMDAVHRYEGYVAQALGDGIFALFGAPIAHEDHSQRALYAALSMQDEMHRYGDQIRLKHGVPLAMRVGINTGEVVMRSIRKDDLHTDYVPVGHSTNLAARMEQMAMPGSILVTAYTYKLTEGYFAFKDLGQTQIKGVEEPLNIYEVLGAGPLRTRLQVAARRGLTRFVGRQSELEQLHKALDQAKAGHGQIVGVMGEPGLGKSRLFYEFKLLSHAGCLILEAYSVSHSKASPYLPVMELLKNYFDIQPQDDERKRREKVAGKVVMLDRTLEDTLPYLFALLGIEEQPSPLQQMDAQIRRKRTVEALKKFVLRASLNQPLILIFEDLHWIDSETQGFLDLLSESVASANILLLVSYRPEYRQEWGQKTYYTQIRLAPFGKAEAEEFLDELLGVSVGADRRVGPPESGAHIGAPLQALKQLILEKTEGTPFFMEEVVQELFEQGVLVRDAVEARHAVPLSKDLHIPPTVQGILAARIDRLTPDEKALLQQLAVIGREFSLSLVRQVITQPEDEIYRLLSSLQHREFLYEQPAFPEVEYIFKHALTQEVAYGTVLQEQRKLLHERTGRALEALYAATLQEHYDDLAHHYSRSGDAAKAVEYLGLAGQQAAHRSAHADANRHLSTAIALLSTLPDTAERTQQELTLHIALGVSLMATKGFAAPEVESTYTRAQVLCQQIGEPCQLFPVLYGLWSVSIVRGTLRSASELSAHLFRLAQHRNDPALLIGAHSAQGQTLLDLGELILARTHLEQGLMLYDPQQHRHLTDWYGEDPGVIQLASLAMALWYLGYPDQAMQQVHELLALARALAHPFSEAEAQNFTALIYQYRREPYAVHQHAEALVTVSVEQGFALWGAAGMMMRGWALIEQGQGEEGIRQIVQGLDAFQTTGAKQGLPYYLALLAQAYGRAGQVEQGLATLGEAQTVMDATGERYFEAELYRIKGQFVLASSVQRPASENSSLQPLTPGTQAEAEAEACFLKAIDIARQQQAKSWELRAVMCLVRLRQQQATRSESGPTQHETRARLDEAHKMLSGIFNWFTEGFNTKDLQEAKALIDELRH